MSVVIEKATVQDVPAMLQLVQPEVDKGIVLERDANEMATNIRSYRLAKEENVLLGFGALHVHTLELGEVRSLVVGELYRGKGVGSLLIQAHLKEAQKLGLKEVLVLTYRRGLFEHFGFVEIPKEEVPDQKIWLDCIKCKHFPICDEVSLLKKL